MDIIPVPDAHLRAHRAVGSPKQAAVHAVDAPRTLRAMKDIIKIPVVRAVNAKVDIIAPVAFAMGVQTL